tara:strand:- start:101 stop:295 length:195 start_codon:yes stop_codon:yes gene_type:complete
VGQRDLRNIAGLKRSAEAWLPISTTRTTTSVPDARPDCIKQRDDGETGQTKHVRRGHVIAVGFF